MQSSSTSMHCSAVCPASLVETRASSSTGRSGPVVAFGFHTYIGPLLDNGHGGGALGTGADANNDGDCSQGGSGPSAGRAGDGRALGLALTQALPAPMAARGGVRDQIVSGSGGLGAAAC